MAEGQQQQPEISGEVMFYRQPEALSLEKHRMLGLRQIERPFQFMAGTHVVPITVNEFTNASASYPIIFAGESKAPLAVMGVRGGENLFVTPDGMVDQEAYLPVFARRYPFVFAAEPKGDQLVVCIDRAAPMLVENGDVPLFNGNEPSKYTQDAIEFCKEFERFRLATVEFVKRISDLNLWDTKSVTLTPQNQDGTPAEPIPIADFFTVSEEKLNALPSEQFVKLRDESWLAPIYAQLLSQLQWGKLLNRSMNIAMMQAAQQQQQQGARPRPS